ncbi:hypothetical protein ABPG74_019460 [Tetrahymena malaccensis]
MIINTSTIKIYIFFLTIQYYIKAQKSLIDGCLSYDNNFPQNQCTQCDKFYELNSKKNICVYQKCSSSLYYDESQHINSDDNKCVAICNPLSWRNKETNLCQKQEQCTTSINSGINRYFNITIEDFFVYQNNYYVAQSSYLAIYDKIGLNLVKILQYQKDDIFVANLNGVIFVASQNNFISIWDIIKEQRISKQFEDSSLIKISINTKIVSIQNQYALIYTIQSKTISFQIIYNEVNKAFSLSNQFSIDISAQSIIIIDSQLFIQDSTKIYVYQLTISNQNNNLRIENKLLIQSEFQSSHFNILQTSQLGIYIFSQDELIQFINTNNNQLQSIQVGMINDESIVKTRIFQTIDTDSKEYLIISTLNQLVYKNLITNSQIVVFSSDNQIKDFEVYNFWGKESQLIVYYENLEIKIFEYDSQQNQFIQISQVFHLNHYPYLFKKIKYQNQSAKKKELSYELVSFAKFSIQIIKKGNLEQQQKQQIQSQTITNFKSSFPYQPTEYTISTFKFSKANLIFMTNKYGEVGFYDYSDYGTNSDKLLIIGDDCMRVYSKDFKMLLEDCHSELKDFSQVSKLTLNSDLKIIFMNQPLGQSSLDLRIGQIDLDKQTIKKYKELLKLDCLNYEIIKKFSSQLDELNNNFSVEQIVIFDSTGNLKIYNLDLTVVKKLNTKIKISQLDSISRINDNTYFLIGGCDVLLIDMSTSKSNQVQTNQCTCDPTFYNPNIINISNNNYYQMKCLKNGKVYEYQIDFLKSVVYQNSLEYVQDTGLLFTSLTQKQRYSKLFQKSFQFLIQDYQYGKYIVLYSNKVNSFDIFTNKDQLITELNSGPFSYEFIRNNKQLLILSLDNIDLVDLSLSKIIATYSFDFFLESAVYYNENQNIFYLCQENSLVILDYQLKLISTIYQLNEQELFAGCQNSQYKIFCLYKSDVNGGFNKQQYFLLFYNKISTDVKITNLGFEENLLEIYILADYQYENIIIYGNYKLIIYGFNGFWKYTLERVVQTCKIYSQIYLCQSKDRFIIINSQSLVLTEILNVLPSENYLYISILDLLLFQLYQNREKVQVMQFSTQRIVDSFSTKQQKNIIEFQFDYHSRCAIYLDDQGIFYLYSLDPINLFKSYIQVTEIVLQKIEMYHFSFNNITNDIIIYGKQSFKLDYDRLGNQYEPQIEEPYHYFTKILISNSQVDYLIFNKQNSTLFRYSNQILKYELDIGNSRIADILYNQSSDTLAVVLENSMLFYQLYQYSKNNYIQPTIIQLNNILFQQFITDSLIITYDQKLLHLNVSTGQIIKSIQFNSTQLVKSFSLNKNQGFLVLGFNDGQVLSYDVIAKQFFVFGITSSDPENASINFIQFKEKLESQNKVYVISYSAIMLQIDTSNNSIIEQINLNNGQSNIKQEINNIYPIQTQTEAIDGIALINLQNQQNNIYTQIPSQELPNLIQQTSQYKDWQFVISSNNFQDNNLPLQNDIFSNLALSSLQLFNFNFNFQNQQNVVININQNDNIKEVIFQNITFLLECFGSNQIILSNIQKIVFQNVKISQLDLKGCKDQVQKNSLFFFYNISEIFIYNLEISNNNFYQASEIPIFQFEIANSILIKEANVIQNTNLNSLASFLNIKNVTLLNLTIKNNNQTIQTIQTPGIVSFYRCELILINRCLLESNNQLLLIYSKNSYNYENQIIELKSDILVFKNFMVEKNTFKNQNVISIQNSYIQFNNFTYNQNEGSLLLLQSQTVSIVDGKFTKNKARNGGAIHFNAIQKNIEFENSLFDKKNFGQYSKVSGFDTYQQFI